MRQGGKILNTGWEITWLRYHCIKRRTSWSFSLCVFHCDHEWANYFLWCIHELLFCVRKWCHWCVYRRTEVWAQSTFLCNVTVVVVKQYCLFAVVSYIIQLRTNMQKYQNLNTWLMWFVPSLVSISCLSTRIKLFLCGNLQLLHVMSIYTYSRCFCCGICSSILRTFSYTDCTLGNKLHLNILL